MRLAIVALLLTASPCIAAEIKVPQVCIEVAKNYNMPAPATLTPTEARAALVALTQADQTNLDVRRCQAALKSELAK